jgi:hypothetical protein
MDYEHLVMMADALELENEGDLISTRCTEGRHVICGGTCDVLARTHPMCLNGSQKGTQHPLYDQSFPCLCDCHAEFEIQVQQ